MNYDFQTEKLLLRPQVARWPHSFNQSIITGQLRRLRFRGPRHLVGCVIQDSVETATGLFMSGADMLTAEHLESYGCGYTVWVQYNSRPCLIAEKLLVLVL